MNPLEKSLLEGICQEAIQRLRKNQGCDIDFGYLDEQPSFGRESPFLKTYILRMKIHGESFAVAMQSTCFDQDMPRDNDEEKVYTNTRGNKRAMVVLRIGKLIFNYYKDWLNQHGLGAKVAKQPAIDASQTSPSEPTVSKLQIGGKTVALSDIYARTTIDSVSDTVSDIKDKIDYSEQEVTRLKDILSDTRDEKAKLEAEVQNLKDQLNIVMQKLYDKGVL